MRSTTPPPRSHPTWVALLVATVSLAAGAVGCSRAPSPETAVTGTPTESTVVTSPPATSPTTRPERLSSDSRLSLDGVGPVRIGMTLDEASAAAGIPVRTDPNDPYEPACEYAYPAEGAEGVNGVAFMVFNGRISRVDVGGGRGQGFVKTVSGIGIGSTEADVMRTYPDRIEVRRHPYRPETGHYLVFTPADANLHHLSLIFETDGQRVTSFRSGLVGAVAQIEGCS